MTSRVAILKLSENDGVYSWATQKEVWAKTERTGKNKVFSRHSQSVPCVKITMRKMPISKNNAVSYNGKHGIITEVINSDDRMYMTLVIAEISPLECKVSRTETVVDEVYNRPVMSKTSLITFPAYVTEKYTALNEGDFDTQEITYILVVPKEIVLKAGEVAEIGEEKYCIQVGHTLDENINEYEVFREVDA